MHCGFRRPFLSCLARYSTTEAQLRISSRPKPQIPFSLQRWWLLAKRAELSRGSFGFNFTSALIKLCTSRAKYSPVDPGLTYCNEPLLTWRMINWVKHLTEGGLPLFRVVLLISCHFQRAQRVVLCQSLSHTFLRNLEFPLQQFKSISRAFIQISIQCYLWSSKELAFLYRYHDAARFPWWY